MRNSLSTTMAVILAAAICIGSISNAALAGHGRFNLRDGATSEGPFTLRPQQVGEPPSDSSADNLNSNTQDSDSGSTNLDGSATESSADSSGPLSFHRPSYLINSERLSGDGQVFWPGFLHGMRGWDDFASPVGNPLYFESALIQSELRFVYLWHKFPKGTNIGGGDLNVFALQARVALTERLAFIATKDGYSRLRAGILKDADGWNDASIGLKYAFYVDEDTRTVVTGGLRWEWHNGGRDILQGGSDELSPFISLAKGWDRFHMLANLTGRLPMDRHDGNYILSYDVHFDYEVAPDLLPGFLPMVEFHGLHYLSDGDRLPLGVGGLDYSNIGSSEVAGNVVYWTDLGWEWKLTPHLSWSAAYSLPLHTTDTDIFDQRVTSSIAIKW